jgi:hypothetical protein
MESVISSAQLTYFSNRSIAEVEALQEEVSAIVPAGNIMGLVMSGLVKLRDRTLPANKAKSDVSALLRGLEFLPRNILPRTIYGTLILGPAAALAAYQKLLLLTGKDPDSAFPEGLWQFYIEFAMREDSARHVNETVGFQKALTAYNLNLSPVDRLAAWVCAVSQFYFQYDDLLHNEWRERVYLDLLEQAVAKATLSHKLSFQRLPQAWAAQRPYHRGQDASHAENYALYRRRRFDNFLQSRLSVLPGELVNHLETIYNQRVHEELPAYQQQMTILATLAPDHYRENKTPIPLWQARIAVVYRRRYYLLPACQTDQSGRPLLFETQATEARSYALQLDSGGHLYDLQGHLLEVDRMGRVYRAGEKLIYGYLRPATFQAVRRQIAAIVEHTATTAEAPLISLDDQLIAIKRTEQERARQTLRDETTLQELTALKCAPIVINWDEQDSSKPLGYIRQGKRGLGDHALTIFHTPDSMVFDQSHIFFDGLWGMALSEMLTGEAISWALYFSSLPAPVPVSTPPYHLQLTPQPVLEKFSRSIGVEVCVENHKINLQALRLLCKLLPKRHPELKLTVNDLLVLYRCAFGHDYQLSSQLEDALFEFYSQNSSPEMRAIYDLIKSILAKAQSMNPSIVIPMEATVAPPRERLYPTTFRNPFTELWGHYQEVLDVFKGYSKEQTQANWSTFAEARRSLLAQLNYFGQVMRAYKKVALEGGSASTAAMKLLAYLPNSLLKLLDEIPRRVDILNEVLKGEEVFSNVGQVARGASLTRFISAKDDNDNKTLVWAVITDDNNVLHISLRDFRPHVTDLYKINRVDLAELIAKDYLDAYVTGFNQFVKRLLEILNTNATHTSKEITE